MSPPELSPSLTKHIEDLRAWQALVCEYLGLDVTQVHRLHDQAAPYGRRVLWSATKEQAPTLGALGPLRVEGGCDEVTYVGEVRLDFGQWAEVLKAAGPKPSLLSRTEELIAKGLLYEQAVRDGRLS